jgi:hypothetical protein
MDLAKIVGSNSHIDYVARVIDKFDTDSPPSADDVGFGDLVLVNMSAESAVGVIYDSQLINPEYANFGPRLTPAPTAQTFTPDFIGEQGTLIGILLLGSMDGNGKASHGVPRRVIPPGSVVEKIDAADIKNFHTDANGSFCLHYYSQVLANTGNMAVPLLETIIASLLPHCPENDRRRLEFLSRDLKWQRTMGGMRT